MKTLRTPIMIATAAVLAAAALTGCKGKPLSSKACAVDPDVKPITDAESAGCLIVVDGGLLVIRRTGLEDGAGRVTPPGGGRNADETARCAAVRETLEETGLRVKAGALFGGFRNDFMLFQCELEDPADMAKARTSDVPEAMLAEAKEKLILDLPAMTNRKTGGTELWAFTSNVVITHHHKDIPGLKPVEKKK